MGDRSVFECACVCGRGPTTLYTHPLGLRLSFLTNFLPLTLLGNCWRRDEHCTPVDGVSRAGNALSWERGGQSRGGPLQTGLAVMCESPVPGAGRRPTFTPTPCHLHCCGPADRCLNCIDIPVSVPQNGSRAVARISGLVFMAAAICGGRLPRMCAPGSCGREAGRQAVSGSGGCATYLLAVGKPPSQTRLI